MKKSPLRGWVLESMGLWFFIQKGEHRKKGMDREEGVRATGTTFRLKE